MASEIKVFNLTVHKGGGGFQKVTSNNGEGIKKDVIQII